MRRLCICLVFFILLGATSNAQQEPDDPFRPLQNTTDDTSRVLMLNKMAGVQGDTSIERSVQYARQALNLANEINYRYGIALSNKNFGEIFTRSKNYQPALNYFLICIKIFEELGRNKEIAEAYNAIGEIYKLQGKPKQALDHFNQALRFADKAGNKQYKADAFHEIGRIHFDEGNIDQAYNYFQKALLLREEIKDSTGMAASYNNVGEIYRIRGDFERAMEYYGISLTLNQILGNREWIAINYLNIGNINLQEGYFENALENYRKSLSINQEINNLEGIVMTNISLGKYYIETEDFEQAKMIFERSLGIARTEVLPRQVSEAALGMSNAHSGINNNLEALKYYKIYSGIRDSLFDAEKHKQLAEMEARYEADRQKQELLLKDQQIRMNERIIRLQLIMAIVALLLLIVIGLLIYARQKSKIKKDRELIAKNRQIHDTRQKLMQNELKSKNNELMNFALHIVQKNDFLQAVKKDLRVIKTKCDGNEQPQKINELFLKVNQNLRMSTELEEFQKNVDQVNLEFFEKLAEKFPNLTENEKRLSALLRLNLSSKEIATLNNISIKAVEMGRYRLRKKLKLGTNEVLTGFLQEL